MIKLRANECELKGLTDKNEVIDFLNANHKQNSAAYIIAYGLFKDDTLLQVVTFGSPRFNKNYQWEIIRDCTKIGYQINGGISKIWKHFLLLNNVHSCICYSYPHDGEYTNKYVDYCGFKNIKKSKPEKKIYFEGIWNGEAKRIDKSILERQGVDRLLRGSFGHNRTNEQILLDLGFEKKYEDGYSPQVDSYFPFGVLYRIQDVTDGSFYIGITRIKENWENGYMGSGSDKWQNHLKKHPDINKQKNNPDAHEYKRIILKDDFDTPTDLFKAEVDEIRKYCIQIKRGGPYIVSDPKCMNVMTTPQWEYTRANTPNPCSECGGTRGHKKTCSKYKITPDCPECGGKDGHHRKGCSKYTAVKKCPECGGPFNAHYKTCSQYKDKDTCPECGGKINAHYKTCSHYVAPEKCPECGSPNSRHKKTCSHYKELPQCPECGSRGAHKSTCSHFRKLPDCPECDGKDGKHRKGCSKYTAGKVCPECGGENNRHMKTCSKYANKGCPECGSKTVHKSWCSKAIVCPECGGKNNRHKKGCSKYIAPKSCPECGSIGMHKITCSHYKENKCPECGGKNGHHMKNCAKYIKNR